MNCMAKHHPRRVLAMLLAVIFILSALPIPAFAAQEDPYHDPAERWLNASNRTSELDVNAVVTQETNFCPICGRETNFTIWRTPEYTKDGNTAMTRNVRYSDGTLADGSGTGIVLDGTPGVDAYYTGYHWNKSVCEMCGHFNTNTDITAYEFDKNVYILYDCATAFTEQLEDVVTYEYTDSTYHTKTTEGGNYCEFCYGTHHTHKSELERHTMEPTIIPQIGHNRFLVRDHCTLCDYEALSYVTAKNVVASYFGEVDGQPHTITLTDLSDPGVITTIRYGNSADSCTLTTAPNYSEEGQYTVYYQETYSYSGESMTENGVAYVWLHDESGSSAGGCNCGCGDPNCNGSCTGGNCSCSCGGNCKCTHGRNCGSNGCGENHHYALLDTVPPTCMTLGYDRYLCSVCGAVEKRNYVNALNHAYSGVVVSEASCQHEGKLLEICINCGDVKVTDTPKGEHEFTTYSVAPTCTGPGYTVRECQVCGERHIENITEANGHSFVSYITFPTCTTGGHTLHICSDCGDSFVDNYIPPMGHSMDDGRVLTPAVCDHDGVIEYTCVSCGHTKRETIPATGHNPGPAATCLNPQTCLDCGAVLAQATGHDIHSTVIAPTCLEMGHTDYYCVNCDLAYDGDYVNPLGHDYIGVVTPPTCTERGYTTFTCSRCGDSYIGDYVDATGHSWDEGTVIKDPTCTGDGVIEYRCLVCEVTRLENYSGEIVGGGHDRSTAVTLSTLSVRNTLSILGSSPVLQNLSSTGGTGGTGHSYVGTVTAPTCTERGFTSFVCVTCGDSYVSNFTEALGHNYKAVVTAPTCTELGYTTYTCDRCGDSYVANYTNALGHSWKTPVILTNNTCNSDGIMEYECSRCDAHYHEAISAKGHNPGPAATCDSPQVCLDCGAVLAPATRHNYKSAVTAPTCTELGYTTYTCSNCNDTYKGDYVRELGHSYRKTVTAATCEAGGYTTYTCTRCGDSYVDDYTDPLGHDWKEPELLTSSTCNSEGLMEYNCSRCNAHYHEAVSASGHNPGPAATCNNPQTCLICGAVLAEATGHDYRTTVTAPTCNGMGFTTYTCANCGDSYKSDYTDPLGHDYKSAVTAPTCLDGGYTTYTCSRCGNSYQDDFTDAKGHRWDGGTVLIASSCDRDGVMMYTCQDCGAEKLEPIPATSNSSSHSAHTPLALTPTSSGGNTTPLSTSGHTYTSSVIAPTCTALGYTTYTCTGCGDSFKTDYVNALGHDYRAVVTAPTCTAGGYTTFTCSRCGDSYIGNYTAALGHNWKAPVVLASSTCNGDGVMEYDCSRCDAHYHEAISAKGHNPGPAATCDTPQTCRDCGAILMPAMQHNYKPVVTAPTCTELGYTAYTCSTCGDSYKGDYIRELGHSYRKTVTAPTCDAGGYTTYTCSRCGDSYVDDYTDPLGHNWTGPVTLASGTCNSNGVLEYNCSRCNAHYNEAISASGHNPGAAATCLNPQTCQDCGAVLVPAKGHTYHSTVTAPTCTKMGYTTYVCADCGDSYKSDYTEPVGHSYQAVVTAPTCVEGGYTTYTCANCGDSYVSDYTEALGHNWDAPATLSGGGCNSDGVLQYDCTRCEAIRLETSPAAGHNPGPAATCLNPQTCLDCGAVLAPATNHSYKATVTAPTCLDLGYTTYTCENCGESYRSDYVRELDHDYRADVTAPTCTESGYTVFTCAHCGDTYTANFTAALGHDWTAPVMLSSNTCNSDGVLDYGCSRCGAHRLEAVSATGHNPGPSATCNNPQTCLDCGAVLAPAISHNYRAEVTAPTCTELGYTTYTCANCGDSYRSDYVRESGHHYEADVTLATCNEGGYTTYTCFGCGDSYVDGYTDPLGHDWGTPERLVSNSCAGDGLLEYRCTRCNEHYHEAVSAAGHNPGPEATCMNPQVCQDCGAVLAPATGHNYQADVTPATCTKMGYTTYTCANCGDMYRSDYTEATGHHYEAVVTKPTCTERGYTTYTCSGCGDSYQDDFTDAKGHRLDNGKILTPGVCGHDGVVQYFCQDCDYMTLETIPATEHVPGPEATCVDPQVCTVCGTVLAQAKGHDLQSEVIPASCLDMGHTHYFCENCGFSYDSEYTLPVGHDYVPVVTEPTCLEAGYTTYTCSRCGDSYTSDHVDPLGHLWDQGTLIVDISCNGEGVLEHHCVRCDYHYLEALSPAGHKPGSEATCTEPQVCTVCGALLAQAKGHKYESMVTEPTCKEMGFTTYTCADCKDSYKSDYVKAAGHKADEWIVDKEPTVSAEGSKHKECSVCKEKLETAVIEKLYLSATTDTHGEATVGEYFVTVTDADSVNPISNATVTLNKDGTISVRLPDSRLIDYDKPVTVTVQKSKDKSAIPNLRLILTDRNGNISNDATNGKGQFTAPTASASTNTDGKATIGYTDSKGKRQTVTVVLRNDSTGRPIANAGLSVSRNGTLLVVLPDGVELDANNRISVVLTENTAQPMTEMEVNARNDLNNTANGKTGEDGKLSLPVIVIPVKEKHGAYIDGYPDGTFRPERGMTRAEAATIFARLLAQHNGDSIGANGHTRFNDVPAEAWYSGYIRYLSNAGVIYGDSSDNYEPDREITRAEFVALAARTYAEFDIADNLSGNDAVVFRDVSSVDWAANYIREAAMRGWVEGYEDGSFRPDRNISRAEVVTIVNRLLGRVADEVYIAKNIRYLNTFTDMTRNHWAYFAVMEAANAHTATLDQGEVWSK